MIVKKEVIVTVQMPEKDYHNIRKAMQMIIDDEKYNKLETAPLKEALERF